MKRDNGRRGKIAGYLFLLLILALGRGTASAETVTQLNITGGSVDLSLGHVGSITGDFTQDGVLVMGTFQPPPDIFPALHIGHYTLSIFTDSVNGVLPPPSAQVSGTAMTADLSSLFAGITGPHISGTLNIGGLASGSYDPETGAFSLTWTHVYDTLGWHHLTFGGNLGGGAVVTPVPLPPAFWLLGAGLLSLAMVFRRKSSDAFPV